ncbi:MAG: ABC-2 family transporter protein [Actinomycetota bacterium]
MRLWWEVARRGFRRYATYRWATAAGVFTNTIFGLIRAYVFIAMFERIGSVDGYTVTDALTYTFISQGFLMPLYLWGWEEIAETVQSGQVATDLYRPFDYQAYWLFLDLGRATYHALLRGFPPVLVGLLLFDVKMPSDPIVLAAFVVSFYLAVVVSFSMRFMANLTAFWVINQRGVQALAASAWTLLSGFTIPIALFPDALRDVIWRLPFVAMLEIPMDIFLGRAQGAEMLGHLAIQAVWAAVLLLAGRVMLAAATRKLVIQGG